MTSSTVESVTADHVPRSRATITVKAVGFVIALMAAILIAAATTSIVKTNDLLAREQQRAAHALASGLSTACELPLALHDVAELEALLRRVLENSNILFTAVYDHDHRMIARASRGDDWEKYLAPDASDASDGNYTLAVQPITLASTRSYVDALAARGRPTASPEVLRSGLLGHVSVALSPATMEAARADHTITTLTMALVASMITVPLVLWLVGRWTRRLSAVVIASERIAHGDLSHCLDESGNDEIGRLAHAHEQMRGALLLRECEMRAFHEDLQRQVAERTKDLEEEKNRAETANRSKSEFLANMSHELRTPMHGILSFASFGLDNSKSNKPEKIERYFRRIDDSARRLLYLLNDLLDLSKLEAGVIELNAQPVNVAPLIGSVIDEFASLLSTQNKSVRFAERSDAIFTVDQDKLMQVVRNLVGNAVKFSPEGSEIEVAMHATVRGLEISVADRGMGIPADELESVFDKFVQSSKTKTGAGGTGLGLAISKEICNLHGGSIRAENRDGGGARFVIDLPAANARDVGHWQRSLSGSWAAVAPRARG